MVIVRNPRFWGTVPGDLPGIVPPYLDPPVFPYGLLISKLPLSKPHRLQPPKTPNAFFFLD